MSYTKGLKEQATRIAVDLQNIVDKAKNEGNRGLTADERTKFDKLVEDHTSLEADIKRATTTDSITSIMDKAKTSPISDVQVEEIQDSFRLKNPRESRIKTTYDKSFNNYMVGGEQHVNLESKAHLDQIKNTMSTTTGSQGGYLVPQGFSDMLEEAKKWFGGIDGTVKKFVTATGNPVPWPTNNDTSNKGRLLAQNTQVTQTDPSFGSVTFNSYIYSSDICLVPLALIEDSYFDMEAFTAKILGTRLGRGYNYQCTLGAGTTAPTGIITAAITAGNVVTAGGSTTSGETASITYDDLVNLEHAVDPAYRFNPSSYWMFSDAMLKLLKKLVDGNSRPLWQPGLTASFINGAGVTDIQPRILDHPYIINQDIAVPAVSAYSALFGDMSTFVVREVASGTQLLVLRERYADYLQNGYTAFQRFDSNLIDAGTHPIAVFQQSAS